MAYTKRTCVQCGWKAPQNEMSQIVRRVEVARGRDSISGSTIIGAIAGHKASSRKIGSTIFNSGQRTYTRKQKSWFCANCAEDIKKAEGAAETGKFISGIFGGLIILALTTQIPGYWDGFGSAADSDTGSDTGVNVVEKVEVARDTDETTDFLIEAAPLVDLDDATALGSGPSFDCAAASQPSELAICGSATLSQLDLRLAASFAQAGSVLPGTVARDLGRDLLKDRQFCEADVRCLEVEMTRAVYQFEEMSRFGGDEMEAAFLALHRQDRIRVQSNLGTTGHYTSGVDGLWGPGTSAAIYGRLVTELREAGSLEHKADPAAALQDLANWR